jgi:hypothetical protein
MIYPSPIPPHPSDIIWMLKKLSKIKHRAKWIVPDGFSVWRFNKDLKIAEVAGDNSNLNGKIKRLILELGWSVAEWELEGMEVSYKAKP